MDLEIRAIQSADADPYPDNLRDFSVSLQVFIGEQGREGVEVFQFVAVSSSALEREVREGEFLLLRGYILLAEFDWGVIHRAIRNLIDHARSRPSWDEVLSFFDRYGIYDSEDQDGARYP